MHSEDGNDYTDRYTAIVLDEILCRENYMELALICHSPDQLQEMMILGMVGGRTNQRMTAAEAIALDVLEDVNWSWIFHNTRGEY